MRFSAAALRRDSARRYAQPLSAAAHDFLIFSQIHLLFTGFDYPSTLSAQMHDGAECSSMRPLFAAMPRIRAPLCDALFDACGASDSCVISSLMPPAGAMLFARRDYDMPLRRLYAASLLGQLRLPPLFFAPVRQRSR